MRILLLYMRKYGILANRKPLMCIVLAQTCLFHLLKHLCFGRMRCRNYFFLFSNMTCRIEQKYNIKNRGHRPS